jgi:hypothetical protein
MASCGGKNDPCLQRFKESDGRYRRSCFFFGSFDNHPRSGDASCDDWGVPTASEKDPGITVDRRHRR